MSRTTLFLSALAASSTLIGGNGYDGRFDLYTGWRRDDLDWSIQGPLGQPDVFAEVDWKSVDMVEVGARGYLAGWDHIYVRLNGNYAKIIQAQPIYSVYSADNRQGLISQSIGCKTGNSAFDLKGAIGFHLLPNCGPFDLAFCAGFAWMGQNLRFRNPGVDVSPFTSDFFVADGVLCRYHPRWKSGFLGVDAMWNICRRWSFSIQSEFHYGSYRGTGWWDWAEPAFDIPSGATGQYFDLNWNDCSTGWGQIISGTVTYSAGHGWYWGVIGGYRHFQTRECDYAVVGLESNVNPILNYAVTFPDQDARLNPITWESLFVGFTFECHF